MMLILCIIQEKVVTLYTSELPKILATLKVTTLFIMCKFSEDNRIRVGNVTLYIAQNTQHPSKTKVLKLMYLMEERWVLKSQFPFLGIPYEVWQAGPVAKDIYVDLSDGPVLLSDYVTVNTDGKAQYVEPVGTFDPDEFSDAELKVMKEVIDLYGDMTATQLVQYTHREGSLWYKAAKENDLLEAFERHQCNSSDVLIDFSKAMTPCDAEFYEENLSMFHAANYYGTR